MSPAQTILLSRLTFVTKVVFPIVWIGGFGIGTIALWINKSSPDEMKWGFLTALIVGSLSIWWNCARLKRACVDDGLLVPIDTIERVGENRWINIHPVTLHFRRFTDFGNKIVFMPKTRVMLLWRSHPVVSEIKRMVEVATTESGKERNSE